MKRILFAVVLQAALCQAAPARAAERAVEKEVVVPAALPSTSTSRPTHRPAVRLHHTGSGEGGEWDEAYRCFARAWGSVPGKLVQRFG